MLMCIDAGGSQIVDRYVFQIREITPRQMHANHTLYTALSRAVGFNPLSAGCALRGRSIARPAQHIKLVWEGGAYAKCTCSKWIISRLQRRSKGIFHLWTEEQKFSSSRLAAAHAPDTDKISGRVNDNFFSRPLGSSKGKRLSLLREGIARTLHEIHRALLLAHSVTGFL